MGVSSANEQTFDDWQGTLPAKFQVETEGQATLFQALDKLLSQANPGAMKLLQELGHPGAHRICHAMNKFLTSTIGALWQGTVENFHSKILSKQPFFIQSFGDSVQFLPKTTDIKKDVLRKCTMHALPSVQLKTLQQMAGLTSKEKDFQELVKAYNYDALKFRALLCGLGCLRSSSSCWLPLGHPWS